MNQIDSTYALPRVMGQQYILSSIIEESADTITYAATQKDMRRDVIVETLRPQAALEPRKVRFFIETARMQTRVEHPSVAAPLELLEAEGTWHLAKEKIKGEPLDMMVSNGRVLPSEVICGLMQQLCRACIYMDMERIACAPFALEHTYLMETGFRFDNMALAGPRPRNASMHYLANAARFIAPLLDMNTVLATPLLRIMEHMRLAGAWRPLSPVLFIEDLSRLQMEMQRY